MVLRKAPVQLGSIYLGYRKLNLLDFFAPSSVTHKKTSAL